jgi:uncharacterized protein YdeI (BOF family)
MKEKMLIIAMAISLFPFPVLAQQGKQQSQTQSQGQNPASARGTAPAVRGPNDVYDCKGKYLGTDPDPKIRANLLQQGDPTCR